MSSVQKQLLSTNGKEVLLMVFCCGETYSDEFALILFFDDACFSSSHQFYCLSRFFHSLR